VAREYAPEVKAAVMAALLAGQSVDSVAEKFEIPEGTVKAWKSRNVKPILEGVAGVATPKTHEEVADLLMELTRAELRGLIALAQHMTNEKWLEKQGAEQLGVLKGITHDKVFRLLEALNRPDDGVENRPTES
jgi:transposase-like protein